MARTARAQTARIGRFSHLGVAVACFLTALLQSVAALAAGAVHVAIRAQTEHWPEVRCSTLVTDEAGQPISGLARDAFTVAEDGREVADAKVRPFRTTQERIAVAIVIDRSGSMSGKPIEEAREAARGFAARLSGVDALSVVTFGGKRGTGGMLTTDKDAALAALDRAQPKGKTALYDAVQRATTAVSHCPANQKAVVVLTDGNDNASSATAEACVQMAKAAGIAIYSIGLGKSVDEADLRTMSEGSGGAFLTVASPADLTAIFQQIAGQIRNRYEIAYTSSHTLAQGPWVTVRVLVRTAGGDAVTQAQYLTTGAAAGPANESGEGSAGYVVVALVVTNAALAIMLVRRRRGQPLPESERRARR